jgi:hypothetical protein
MKEKRPSFVKGKTNASFPGKSNAQRKEDGDKRKAIFLEAFEEWGTIKKGCEAAGVTRMAYGWWLKTDPDFAKSVDLTRQSFSESLEMLALDRVKNPDKNRGSDLLLLGLLNANMPAKYRPSVALDQDSAKELITEWRKASQSAKKDGVKEGEPLPASVEDTLAEILGRKKT